MLVPVALILPFIIITTPLDAEFIKVVIDYADTVPDTVDYPHVYLLNEADCPLKLVDVRSGAFGDLFVDLVTIGLLSYADAKDGRGLDVEEMAALNQIYTPRSGDDYKKHIVSLYVASPDTVLAYSLTAHAYDFFDEFVVAQRVVGVGEFKKSGRKHTKSSPAGSRKRREIVNHSGNFPLYGKQTMKSFIYVDRIRFKSGKIWRVNPSSVDARIAAIMRGSDEQ